jgi:uncharacterized protein (DUF433 family)
MTYLTDRITVSEGLCNGKPTIRGMRISVQTVLGFLRAGDSKAEILEAYPLLEPEDIDACLDYAIHLADRQIVVKPLAAA